MLLPPRWGGVAAVDAARSGNKKAKRVTDITRHL